MEKDLNIDYCQLMFGDCLERMKEIGDKSIDMILCDLPYGTTDCKWDSIIPFDKLWDAYNRIIKDNGAIALFGSEPFSSKLRMSNIDWYKYDWIWSKTNTTGFQHAKNMPLKDYEIISIFSKASIGHVSLLGNKRMEYNPQGVIRINKLNHSSQNQCGNITGKRPSHKETFITEYKNYPKMTLRFSKDKVNLHPTQKPIALLEYLIKTYSNGGDLILDNCMGSGSTGVACVNTNRNFIGIELDEKFYDISCKRIKNAIREKEQDLFK